MKMNRAWKIRLGALCLTGLCLGTGAALAAGDADDPLVTLSYLNETVLPKLLSQTDEKAKVRQTELANQLSQVMAQGGGGASASYTVVTLNPGQRMDLDIGCEVLLRVGSATAGAAVDPALVDVSAGGRAVQRRRAGAQPPVSGHYVRPLSGGRQQHGEGAGPGRLPRFISEQEKRPAGTDFSVSAGLFGWIHR